MSTVPTPTAPESPVEAVDEELAPPTTRHAVWCLTINMGSCNGCDQMVASLLAPRYQLVRRGIAFAASPRHADIVLVTGTLTRRTLEPVKRVLAQVPEPHVVIAVGDCAINGGPFAGSSEVIANASDLLNANIDIAGDPPTPARILAAIEAAAQLLDEDETEDGIDDHEDDGALNDDADGEDKGESGEDDTETENVDTESEETTEEDGDGGDDEEHGEHAEPAAEESGPR